MSQPPVGGIETKSGGFRGAGSSVGHDAVASGSKRRQRPLDAQFSENAAIITSEGSEIAENTREEQHEVVVPLRTNYKQLRGLIRNFPDLQRQREAEYKGGSYDSVLDTQELRDNRRPGSVVSLPSRHSMNSEDEDNNDSGDFLLGTDLDYAAIRELAKKMFDAIQNLEAVDDKPKSRAYKCMEQGRWSAEHIEAKSWTVLVKFPSSTLYEDITDLEFLVQIACLKSHNHLQDPRC